MLSCLRTVTSEWVRPYYDVDVTNYFMMHKTDQLSTYSFIRLPIANASSKAKISPTMGMQDVWLNAVVDGTLCNIIFFSSRVRLSRVMNAGIIDCVYICLELMCVRALNGSHTKINEHLYLFILTVYLFTLFFFLRRYSIFVGIY